MAIVCTWKTDGSEGCQKADFAEDDGGFTRVDVVTMGGSPVNLLGTSAAAAVPLPDSYWLQVQVVEMDRSSSLSVGVSLPSQFAMGYKNRGMFYNGNLTNGISALKVGFGPHLRAGDLCTIGCTTHAADGSGNAASFVMTVYLNGKKVGRGFEIDTADIGNERFLPCISVYGKVQFTAGVVEEEPEVSKPESTVHGKWRITHAYSDVTGEDQIVPVLGGAATEQQRDVLLTVAPGKGPTKPDDAGGGAQLHLSVRVFNTMGTRWDCVAAGSDGRSYERDASVAGRPPAVMTTMMAAPPPYDGVERNLATAMAEHWRTLRLKDDDDNDDGGGNNDDELVITSGTGHIMARCIREVPSDGAALTSYTN